MSFYDRQLRGAVAYHTGCAAEAAVEQSYIRAGYRIVAQRWRGRSGEIDLICRHGDGWVFVEVKAGRDWARAAERITPRQAERVQRAALEFLAEHADEAFPGMRFDAALVDGYGRIDVIDNAFM